MEIEGRTVLVTGAAGTVGSAVVERLTAEGATVRAMVRSAAEVPGAEEVVEADLTDAAAVARAAAGAELAVHCAAAVSDDWEACRATNVRGTQNLLDALIAEGAERLVHVSTVSVYDMEGVSELDESTPLLTEPKDAYGYTKAEAERRVRAAEESGLTSVILRPGTVLSTHPKSHWGPRALERAREDGGPLFPVASMPHVHVDNLAQAVGLAATRREARGRAYNVVDGHGATEEYQRAVFSAVGRPVPELPSEGPDLRVVAERIRRELGYDPPDRWEEFLRQVRELG